MKPLWYALLTGLLFVLGMTAGYVLGLSDQSGNRETVFQVSTIDALLQGKYDGSVPFSEIRKHGDFGIATFHALDGEMVALDGNFFQVRADGRVYPVDGTMTAPFASVTYFEPDSEFFVANTENISCFEQVLIDHLPSPNLFYAVRVDGSFAAVKARSIPAQQKPYPDLVNASADQSIFYLENTTGTMVGFWTPGLVKGLNVPGLHLHYISADRTAGGHVLDMTTENATVRIDITNGYMMVLPEHGEFLAMDLGRDLEEELGQVERSTEKN